MSEPACIVAEYYPHIDAVDTDWVIELFADDAVYRRADVTYAGLPAIARFFREERKIRGRHTLEGMWIDSPSRSVVVTGQFVGEGIAGDPRSVGFADVWQFNTAMLVARRQTYLALGHRYVEQ
jgi:ketosteroid isomerase-like protein